MPLTVGSRLGHYQVDALIGEGGMGQVYQATDTKLNRQVALKILPEAFAADPDRLARFQREAQVLASLNHPNIAAIHGLEESDDTRALVLELVEGPTLADRISRGPIPLDEALPIAKQIAEALEAAHEAGVIHRDLKPANIKVRDDGTVKVLDFGLAKALDTTPQGDPSQSPTLTAAATQMGVIMGTAAYMSPEQAKGRTVDRRGDVWAFGAVLFEMLTGQRAFAGTDVSEVLAAVIRAEPAWDALTDTLPHLNMLLKRCLEKEPRQRVQAAGDVRLAMEGAFETVAPETAEAFAVRQPQVWQSLLPPLLVGLVLLASGGLAVWSLTPDPVLHLGRFVVTTPPSEPVNTAGRNLDLAISPDGRRVVYVIDSPRRLYVRAVDQLSGTQLVGTEGAYAPFFSPNGAWIGFQSAPGGVTLKKVSVLGGPSETLCSLDSPLAGASWGVDDTIVFATRNREGLFLVAAAGGEPEKLTTPDAEAGESHLWPEILPGGRDALFTIHTGAGSEDKRIALLNLETLEQAPLIPVGSRASYAATGHIVYGTEGTLRAVPFDLTRLSVTGDPVSVVEGVVTKTSFGAVDFALAQDGSFVYVSGAVGEAALRSFVWVDRDGREEVLPLPPGDYLHPRLSPDGNALAFSVMDSGDRDIRVFDLARLSPSRITFGGSKLNPVWSPDGRQLLFTDLGSDRLSLTASAWGGATETLLEGTEGQVGTSWSSDGQMVAFYVTHSDTGRDLWVLPMDGDRTPELFLSTQFNERAGAFSPRSTVAGVRLRRIRAGRGVRAPVSPRSKPGDNGFDQRGPGACVVARWQRTVLSERQPDDGRGRRIG